MFGIIGRVRDAVLRLIGRSRIDRTAPVFETQNIEGITFFRTPDCMSGVRVPSKYMQEIASWIGTFTIGSKTNNVSCGQNTVTFRIEYTDGRAVVNGTDTVTVNNKVYQIKKGPAPKCFYELLSRNHRNKQ